MKRYYPKFESMDIGTRVREMSALAKKRAKEKKGKVTNSYESFDKEGPGVFRIKILSATTSMINLLGSDVEFILIKFYYCAN